MLESPAALLPLPSGISERSRLAAATFLTRYGGKTIDDYTLSLEIYFRWCLRVGLDPLDAKRPHLERFMREHLVEERHNKPSTVVHRMHTIGGYYRFAVIDEFIDKNPAAAIRLPRIWHDRYRDDYLTADELQAFVDVANASDRPSDAGLIALLALLGLRISEVLNVQIEDFRDTVDGHRVLRLIGKGAKPATAPLSEEALEMLYRAAGSRSRGPLLIRDRSSARALVGKPLTYHAAAIAIERLAFDAGIYRHVTPHMFRRGFVTTGLDAGVSIRDMQIAARHSDPSTTSRYDRGARNLDRHANHIISRIITRRDERAPGQL